MTKTTPGAMRATEGPWEVSEPELSSRSFPTRHPHYEIRGRGGMFWIAHVLCFSDAHAGTEYEANARLIAASPAMLEALQALMDEYKQRMDGDYPGENLHQFQSAYRMARAAISAATGEAENG